MLCAEHCAELGVLEDQNVARIADQVIRTFENQPWGVVPSSRWM
jgi:hypothetical protein